MPHPLILQAAAEAAGAQQYPAGALYVVGTPIGNLADLTLRAVQVLSIVDWVACEDTRVTGTLLRHLGLRRMLITLHAHNEARAAQQVLQQLAAGERVALVSDAGTPAVSDPGARVVAAAAAAGHRVIPVPGASSVLAALCVAGDVRGEGFGFDGFLPPKGREREAALQRVLGETGTRVLLEAPHRIELLAAALAAAAPARTVTIGRELTKQFECVATMAAAALPAWLRADADRLRGEFVLVLHAEPPPAEPAGTVDAASERALRVLLRELPLKQAVALAAEIGGAPRKALYALALRWREAQGPSSAAQAGDT
ncbi:MAG TPA: 16S rRNA (cytidine(1402)-2'-O)-methyltransferase [Rubrivivax sp.]|nr:16S rRNA (cytidine(1402)-2'-O)-methyltransferase [Rubrivivax sp.]